MVLLAGAEAIYADLEHVHNTPSIIHWSGLYQRVSSELLAMLPLEEQNNNRSSTSTNNNAHASSIGKEEEISNNSDQEAMGNISPSPLSPPSSPRFVVEPNMLLAPNMEDVVRAAISNTVPASPPRTNTPNKDNSDNNKSPRIIKYKCLRSLLRWLDVKRQWLPFHESLFLTWSPDNLVFLQTFVAALLSETNQSGDIQDDSSGAIACGNLLVKTLRQETQTTLALMEMAFSLERGRYVQMAKKMYVCRSEYFSFISFNKN